ncbi:flavin reductase family protein [Janibacter massiliensis]|uniref:flavin reductase family protein n=1 Tax=Janibacter massiliensis TaxID=2058291 RepID=UPI000D0FB458|nr:flavin reductase family protein [Janibacter massiliensis]
MTRAADDRLPTPDEFRHAIARFPTGVATVTTIADGHDHAMTASSVVSLSLEPPALLFCVAVGSRFHEAVLSAGVWGVSVLGGGQRSVADWLSAPGRPVLGQLDRVPHHRGPRTGVALVEGALAAFECRTRATHRDGDHEIVVGDVLFVDRPDRAGAALVRHRSTYGSVG